VVFIERSEQKLVNSLANFERKLKEWEWTRSK
jgi:hypothetical protein